MLDGQNLGIVGTRRASYSLFGPGSLNVGGFQDIDQTQLKRMQSILMVDMIRFALFHLESQC